MKPIKFMSQWNKEYNVVFIADGYAVNHRLYVGCLCEDEEYGGYEPYCDVTVNLPDQPLPEGNYAFLDTNNGDPMLFKLMKKNGYMKETGFMGYSGFCTYPIVRFSDEFIEMISNK